MSNLEYPQKSITRFSTVYGSTSKTKYPKQSKWKSWSEVLNPIRCIIRVSNDLIAKHGE